MPTTIVRKVKVVLSDYPYRKDIENRLLLSALTSFEVDVLSEITHHSLKMPIEHLAEILETPVAELLPVLDKLSATKLFKRDHMNLIIDKELRKYYEYQIEKFDEDFEPNLDFFQNMLNKVPIHVLPNWYAISRSSDNIFNSIVEKYFHTPKDYQQYLSELQFDDPIIPKLIKDVMHAPDFTVRAADLVKKYKLTREQFEEYILLLEYHFVCCLRYHQVNDRWEEIVSPFHEWLEFLRFQASSKPKAIEESDKIQRTSQEDFWLIHDMVAVLNACRHQKVNIAGLNAEYLQCPTYAKKLLPLMINLGYVKKDASDNISASDKGLLWLLKQTAEQAHDLLVSMPYEVDEAGKVSPLCTQKNIRIIEKSLRGLHANEWIYLDDFLKGFITIFGDKEPITLKSKGKNWKYVLPTYTEAELDFIKSVIMDRLFALGVVATGTYKKLPCFCLTSYGAHFLH